LEIVTFILIFVTYQKQTTLTTKKMKLKLIAHLNGIILFLSALLAIFMSNFGWVHIIASLSFLTFIFTNYKISLLKFYNTISDRKDLSENQIKNIKLYEKIKIRFASISIINLSIALIAFKYGNETSTITIGYWNLIISICFLLISLLAIKMKKIEYNNDTGV
jgi:hypothetical protein